MPRKSIQKRKVTPARAKASREMLKVASIDPTQEPELVKSLSEMSDRRHKEAFNEELHAGHRMSTLLAPHLPLILKQLRKKGIDVDSMRSLLEQSGTEKNPKVKPEQLAQKISEHRAKILEAISEVTDLKALERQVRVLVSHEKHGAMNVDSILAVFGRKEDN